MREGAEYAGEADPYKAPREDEDATTLTTRRPPATRSPESTTELSEAVTEPAPAAKVSPPEGIVIVDKPAGWTSHDVVSRMRRLAGTRRVGHAGTLDPMATGVLVVGIGRATRLLGHISGSDKTYAATIRLGWSTVTDDAEGERLGGAPADGADRRRPRPRHRHPHRADHAAAVVGLGDQGRGTTIPRPGACR